MKRLHIHIAVDDLEQNIRFYSALFQSQPSVLKSDYAKWLLDDPRVNFAISSRGRQAGLDHLGVQVESSEELEAVQQALVDAALPVAEQKQATCCYVQSDKYWSVDPQGIAWEAFHSLNSIPLFGEDPVIRVDKLSPCCKATEPE
ncbi:glyoxalase/bleomycin resistance/dioxygenase family protein [Methylomonas sp. SURF-2]|uniref:Glyoxalase/bleomycin resistance/dioxygenase family protein n=1 Tax=Methylomonas subterranea TaxID=2952225 RepID=A0ABT1THH2_9GAMM|nr:ArsI/CadI family heavy metal resistance metalloenzyme [Methylomonas sp. SURF-2]MCQ8104895.1 glyoxalase/bleomycin resistance/dioxygenase family protein [Methylomonas sp. SURF-2]